MTTVLVVLAVSWLYLTVVRFVDMNEREPVWALVVAFLFGGAAALALHGVLGRPDVSLDAWRQAAASEGGKFAALLLTVATFTAVARLRGWSELSDVIDGMVYGIAVGLGFSAADTLTTQLAMAGLLLPGVAAGPVETILRSALGGLAHGVFGGVIGLGIGAAMDARTAFARVLYAFLGLAGGTVSNALFFELRHGNALGGQSGLTRAGIAVVLPLVALVGVGLYSLAAERRVIRLQLAGEVERGTVPAADAALLDSFWGRQLRYMGLLIRGRWSECMTMAGRHSRQVQLALAKQRADRAGRVGARARAAELDAQVAALRKVVAEGRRTLALCLVAAGLVATPRETRAQTVASTDSLLALAGRDIGSFWSRELGLRYRAPTKVGPYPLSGPCPFNKNNAQYCQPLRSIFYDPAFLNQQHTGIGDFAAVFVLAHEWGHLVQDIGGADQDGLELNIQWELQADCYAGRYARDAKARGVLSPGDDNEAIASLAKGRDPVDFPWYDDRAHGSGGRRVDAFQDGFDGLPCAGAAFWRHVNVDPSAAPVKTPPQRGAASLAFACARGAYRLTESSPRPALVKGKITDVLYGRYEKPDRTVMHALLYSVTDSSAARQIADNTAFEGYTETKSGRSLDGEKQVGKWRVLIGTSEIVILQRWQVIDVVEGPIGKVWDEFFAAPPVFTCK